jgi:hypothetical protein
MRLDLSGTRVLGLEQGLRLVQILERAHRISRFYLVAREREVGIGVRRVDLDGPLVLAERRAVTARGGRIEPVHAQPQRCPPRGIALVGQLREA